MYTKRHMEDVIKNCIKQFPVLLITGPRQVGKTTMIEETCKEFNSVTFDDPILLNEVINEPNLF